jgi:hypothetical protein
MSNFILNKIKSANIIFEPYPHIVIENFLEDDFFKKLNLPNYDDIDDNVYFQDNKHSKKSIVDNSLDNSNYLKLLKINKNFKSFDDIFKNNIEIKNVIFKKFEKYLKEHLSMNLDDINTTTSINYSVSKPGYLKEIHIDRREHIINILYYLNECDDSAKLELWKEKKLSEINDVFPKRSDLLLSKSYPIKKNSAIIMINLPCAYHSVSIQSSKFLNRKYIYVVWDYVKNSRITNVANNKSIIWKKKVSVVNENRRINFINNEKNI